MNKLRLHVKFLRSKVQVESGIELNFHDHFVSPDDATIITVEKQNLLTGRNCRCLGSLGQIIQQ